MSEFETIQTKAPLRQQIAMEAARLNIHMYEVVQRMWEAYISARVMDTRFDGADRGNSLRSADTE